MMEYYTTMRINALELHITTWNNLINIRLSRRSQTQRLYCVIPLTESTMTGKTKLWGEKSRHRLPLEEQ